jgi:DNA-binding transcriptional ArsR family regulator
VRIFDEALAVFGVSETAGLSKCLNELNWLVDENPSGPLVTFCFCAVIEEVLDRTVRLLYLTCRLNTMGADPLSTTFAALADPTRRSILARLALGERSVTKLAEPFEMSLPAVSKHLKVLERAGLIRRGRDAQWRPCRLDARGLKDVAEWVEHYRRFWTESFDRLDDYLRELRKEKNHGRIRRRSK